VVVVSTCLPGTFDREVRPLVGGDVRVAYHPLFIAMGSVIGDYRNPEFVLVGSDTGTVPLELLRMYWPLYGGRRPYRQMSITSAELTKVAYNAAIGYKLMLANGVAELADKVGADCDSVMGTLKLATDRVVSEKYLTPGMGDGGGCHPRDQIALSWLAGDAGLSHDPFGFIIRARERHARWLAHEWEKAALLVAHSGARARGVPMVMLGEAYKPNSTLTTGSHARLVAHYAREFGCDIVTTDQPLGEYPVAAYFLATPHDHFMTARLSEGSVLVDPWGVFPDQEGVEIVRPGRRANPDQRARSCDAAAAAGRVA
jgi:UDPglucose 6-dehydrogenase